MSKGPRAKTKLVPHPRCVTSDSLYGPHMVPVFHKKDEPKGPCPACKSVTEDLNKKNFLKDNYIREYVVNEPQPSGLVFPEFK